MQSNDIVVSRRTLLKAGFYFFLLNSALFLLLSFRYLSFVSDEARADSPLFLYSLQLSHFIFLAFLPYIFAYLPLTILTKNKRTSQIVAMVTSSLSLIIFLIDSYIFSLYRFHINKSVMDQLLGPDAGQVFELSWVLYLLAVLLLALLLTVEYWAFKWSYRWAEKLDLKPLCLISSVFFVVFFFAQLSHAYAVAHNNRYMVGMVRCFPFCSPLNANRLLATIGWGESKHPIRFKLEGKTYQYPKHALKTKQGTRNVLMLVLDSWNPLAFDSITMPRVYEFSKRSSLYTHHYSGSNGTRTGMFTLFFGLPGVYWPDFESQHVTPVLMDELGRQNYEVKLYPSASMRNPPLDQNVFSRYADQCLATEGEKAWQRDYNLSKKFLDFIESRTSDSHPFFSLLFFDSLHSMIEPQGNGYKPKYSPAWSYPKYELLDKNTDPVEFLNLYKNMANYVDGLIGNVLSRLEEKGLLDSTLVIVTGDHSQEFNDNGKGFWGHNGNYSQSQLCVPLIYFDNTSSRSYDHWTAHYDVVPTLMEDLFFVENPASDYSIGKSLRDTMPRDFLLVDSYIGFGFVDKSGDITNLYYDHTTELQDENLNVRDNSQFDTLTYRRSMALIEGFYKKRP